jgi:hypothetical protein
MIHENETNQITQLAYEHTRRNLIVGGMKSGRKTTGGEWIQKLCPFFLLHMAVEF